MSTIKVNSIEPANAGSEDYFLARAWVNFNGTGTVAIRADGNVSSLTDYAAGQYGVNVSTAPVDANYSIGLCAAHTQPADGSRATVVFDGSIRAAPSTSGFIFWTGYTTGSYDQPYIFASVLR